MRQAEPSPITEQNTESAVCSSFTDRLFHPQVPAAVKLLISTVKQHLDYTVSIADWVYNI